MCVSVTHQLIIAKLKLRHLAELSELARNIPYYHFQDWISIQANPEVHITMRK